jgi:hypothetical protein
MKQLTVVIDPGPPLTVSCNRAELSKDDGDELKWEHRTAGKAFKIDFQGKGPFASPHFDQTNSGSGKVRTDVPKDKNKEYKYTVIVDGQPPLDPLVIVR